MRIHSYPSIYNFGHRAIAEIFFDPVIVQEKIDGSQISFGRYSDSDVSWTTHVRSKGAEIHFGSLSMFDKALLTIQSIQPKLPLDWAFRGEYLMRPKHNVIAYNTTPPGNIVLYDIETTPTNFLEWPDVLAWADQLGLGFAPVLFDGDGDWVHNQRSDTLILLWLDNFLKHESILGGSKVEGVVIKNYSRWGPDKHPLMAKWVSPEFKELHDKSWKKEHPSGGDIIQDLILSLRTEARWQKAVQHLREQGQIEDSPKDIGKLFKEVPEDVLRECTEYIKEELFKWAWKGKLSRGITAGLAEWYKAELVKRVIEDDDGCHEACNPQKGC